VTAFAAIFGGAPDVSASAPGRVNLIGEHTDYNDGYVLPVALARRTTVELARRGGARVRAWSEAAAATGVADYALGAERRRGDWVDYVQGVTRALAAAGHPVEGFDAHIDSAVPVGRGLASSAALEVALLRALRDAFGLDLDDVALARLGQRAEHDFVGAPVGIMDQMAASLGESAWALFLDTRALRWERVPLPDSVELVIIDSGISHRHASGSYGARRAECERAAALLGVRALRDVSPDDLSRVAALPEPLNRRARHVVTENARVLDMVGALRAGDVVRCGRLLDETHASLRDDFEVSLPPIDRLVESARGQRGVYGARLTGGGFGGAIVALARAGEGLDAARRVAGAAIDSRPDIILPAAPRIPSAA
jgi:galactokinase